MEARIEMLAKQAGLLPNHEVYEEDLQRFYKLVRDEALEEAAAICERWPFRSAKASKACAEVIRLEKS